MRTLTEGTRAELAQVEEKLRSLREEKARAAKVREVARAAFSESESDEAHAAAKQAVDSVRAIEEKIDAAQEQSRSLLQRIGDSEAGVPGFTTPGLNGWHDAARKLSLAGADQRLRVDVPATTMLAQAAPIGSTPREPVPQLARGGLRDTGRWLYPVIPFLSFPAPGELVATDFAVSTLEPAVSGVEVDPASADEKAVLPIDVALATPTAKTYAVIAQNVPQRLVETEGALRGFLGREMSRHLSEAVDAAVVDKIEASSPPSGLSGVGLVAQIRNGLAAAADLGMVPDVIALTPTEAATLDLQETTAGFPYFAVKVSADGGIGGDGVWRLHVREVPTITDPTLIETQSIGAIFAGNGSVLADPFGANLSKNMVSIRSEVELAAHVRNPFAAYVISA